ncbi:MAG: hypothetical protein AAFX85_09150, partial [Pseudomonadota bacterium]
GGDRDSAQVANLGPHPRAPSQDSLPPHPLADRDGQPRPGARRWTFAAAGSTLPTVLLPRSPWIRSAVAASVAFTCYAAWALWANRTHPPDARHLAAVTQGLYSALVTLLLTTLVEWLYRGHLTRTWRLTRCILGSVVLLVVSSVAVHTVAGTAELWLTVLPSWIFGSAYAVLYAVTLWRVECAQDEDRAT